LEKSEIELLDRSAKAIRSYLSEQTYQLTWFFSDLITKIRINLYLIKEFSFRPITKFS
jgi:hypothetical protein